MTHTPPLYGLEPKPVEIDTQNADTKKRIMNPEPPSLPYLYIACELVTSLCGTHYYLVELLAY